MGYRTKDGRHYVFDEGPQTFEKAVQDATGAIYQDYYADVRYLGDDLVERARDGEFYTEEDLMEALEQSVDGSQRVIYTFQAKLGLLVSENADYGIEELGAESFDWSDGIPYSALMYYALRQDVTDYLDREYDLEEVFED
jgi:hypothetical protein